ncbi:MAG: indolepyruvate ferredoxin oxidoreductase subunit alpha [Eubacteriales bacterium]
MKELMIGNEALARGLFEGGCRVVSAYPGTPSTEITEYIATYDGIYSEWAPNEKVALEVAFGASLAGARAACAMKHVGLNVAADPLFTLSYTGVTGGLVLCVADDPAMHSSQNEQDSRHYAVAAKVPLLEPADSAECYRFAKEAFALSERFDTPVLLRTCTRIAHSQSLVETGERAEVPLRPYVKNPQKYVMVPGNAKQRHPVVEARMAALAEYAEDCPYNRVERGGSEVGIITAGTCYQYVKEALGETVSVLKLGLIHPLPTKLIRDFAASVRRLVVVEELDGIIEQHCRNLGLSVEGKSLFSPIGEYSQATVRRVFGLPAPASLSVDTPLPVRPPVMCAGCPHRGMFYLLSKLGATVIGDIGCYTLGSQAPLSALDATLCMGASISGLHGFLHADPQVARKTACVIGDSTFMHSGMTGLANIAYNGSAATVIILDNSITGMTGHQHNPTTGYNIKGDPAGKIDLEALCRAMGIRRVRVVDPYQLKETEAVLREELAADEPSVVIARRPCVLLKSVSPKPALRVDPGVCTGCRRCMKIGCPAISMRGDKPKQHSSIDGTLCVGCEVCVQLCAFGAIGKEAQA